MAHSVKDNIALAIAYGFGSGLLPKAPGTWGSLLAIVPGIFVLDAYGPIALIALAVFFFFIGVWAAETHARIHNSHDAGQVVVDEFVGQWLALLPLAFLSLGQGRFVDIITAFIAFRFFDIIKPWPIKWLDQKVTGGFGVMIDDVMAGLFALIAFIGIVWVIG